LIPAIENEILHAVIDDNGVRVVNFITSKSLIVKSTFFLHCSIHKYAQTSDQKMHSQIYDFLIFKRRHCNIVDV
jgi:hypothetical protein